MTSAVAAFAVSATLALLLTPVVRALAIRLAIVDRIGSSRCVHASPVPRLGGVAVVLAFYAPLALLPLFEGAAGGLLATGRGLAVFCFGGMAIALLGVYDDVKGANARQKLGVQLFVGFALYAAGFRIDQISQPFGDPIPLGMLGLPVTMLWVAGMANAVNLIDGLDGLASGVAFFAAGANFVVGLQSGNEMVALLSAALAGAALGFLRFNFNPASIFMGDSGSMFLGFVLAVTSIQAHSKGQTAVSLAVPLVLLGFPVADTFLAMWRRALRGVPLFRADRDHIHHRLLSLGLTHRETVLALYAVSALLAATAVALVATPFGEGGWTYLLAVAGLGGVALYRLGYLRPSDIRSLLARRRRNEAMRRVVAALGRRMRESRDPLEIWEATKESAPVLGAQCVGLHISNERLHRLAPAEFSYGFDRAGPLHRSRHPVGGERGGGEFVEFGFTEGRVGADRDTEIGIELLCVHLGEALRRLERDERGAPFSAAAPSLRRLSGRLVGVSVALGLLAARAFHLARRQ